MKKQIGGVLKGTVPNGMLPTSPRVYGGPMNKKLSPAGTELIYSNPGKIVVSSSPKKKKMGAKKDYFASLKVQRIVSGKVQTNEYTIALQNDGKYHTMLDMRGFGEFKTIELAKKRVAKSMKNLLYRPVGTWRQLAGTKLFPRVGSATGKRYKAGLDSRDSYPIAYIKEDLFKGMSDSNIIKKMIHYKNMTEEQAKQMFDKIKHRKSKFPPFAQLGAGFADLTDAEKLKSTTHWGQWVNAKGQRVKVDSSGSNGVYFHNTKTGKSYQRWPKEKFLNEYKHEYNLSGSVGKRLPYPEASDFGIWTYKLKADAEKVASKIRKLGFKTKVELYKDSGGGDVGVQKWEVVVTLGEMAFRKFQKLEDKGIIKAIRDSVGNRNKGVSVGMKHKKGKRGKVRRMVSSPVESFVIAEILGNPGRKNILELKNVKTWIKKMATKGKLSSSEISHRLNQAMAKAGIVATTTSKSVRNAIKRILPKGQRWMGTKFKSAKSYKKATTKLARVRKTPRRGSKAAKARGKKVSKYWKTVPNLSETVGSSVKSKGRSTMRKRRKSSHKRKVGGMFVSKSSHKRHGGRRVGEMFVSEVGDVGRSHRSHRRHHKVHSGIGAAIGKVNVKKTGSDMLNKGIGIVAGTNLAGLIKQGTDMLFKTKTATGTWQGPLSNAVAGVAAYFGSDFLGKMLKAPQSIIDAAKTGSVLYAIRAIPTVGDKLVKVESGIEGYIDSVANSVAGQLENFRSQGSPDAIYPTEGAVTVNGQLVDENRMVSLAGVDLDAEVGDEQYPGEEYPVAQN
ncbi:MAG: hypothetical protein PHX21_12910 [bacterium]|nr:hypothetical protein [bacterium]